MTEGLRPVVRVINFAPSVSLRKLEINHVPSSFGLVPDKEEDKEYNSKSL